MGITASKLEDVVDSIFRPWKWPNNNEQISSDTKFKPGISNQFLNWKFRNLPKYIFLGVEPWLKHGRTVWWLISIIHGKTNIPGLISNFRIKQPYCASGHWQ